MQLLADYLAASAGDDFVVLCGSATSFYSALALGVHGGVLALSGIVARRSARELRALVAEGRFAEARALQAPLVPLARAIGAQHGVPALKAALTLVGLRDGRPASAAAAGAAPRWSTLPADATDGPGPAGRRDGRRSKADPDRDRDRVRPTPKPRA